jgi:hypothetical protein
MTPVSVRISNLEQVRSDPGSAHHLAQFASLRTMSLKHLVAFTL